MTPPSLRGLVGRTITSVELSEGDETNDFESTLTLQFSEGAPVALRAWCDSDGTYLSVEAAL